MNKFKLGKILLSFFLLMSLMTFTFCDEENDADFSADFSYEFIDDNHVRYTNESSGEYYSLIWDFGNQESDTTSDKNKSYTKYYPYAGDYNVSLKIMNYTGKIKTVQKTVSIETTEFELSFIAEVNSNDPNEIILKNTSIGEYDSFKWIYRNKEISNESETVAYFPYAGSYTIELKVTKGEQVYSESKTVNIAQDDPDYFDKLTLAWSDEFDGTELNTTNWKFETGATGWGNNELQNYTDGDNAEVVDGNLIITARKVNDNTELGSYTSSRIISAGKKEIQYGRIEIRANLPEGTGIWPAIWMLGSNFASVGWPACGEMDIMEYVGYQPNIVHSTVHTLAGYAGAGDGSSKTLETCEEEFHIYGLLWTEKKLVFYTDSIENITHIYNPSAKTSENWPFDKPAFFIFNIAVGGTWGGAQGVDNSIFPQTMEIDYVRVYQEP